MIEIILLGVLSGFLYFRKQILEIIEHNKLQKEIIFFILIILTLFNFGITISSILTVLILIVILYKKKCVELSGFLWNEIVKFEKVLDEAVENSPSKNLADIDDSDESVNGVESVNSVESVDDIGSVGSDLSIIKENKKVKKKVKLASKMNKIKKRMNDIMVKMSNEIKDDLDGDDLEGESDGGDLEGESDGGDLDGDDFGSDGE